MDPCQLDCPLHVVLVLQVPGDDVVVRMVFIEIQPFKGVENYVTDSLLYQEDNKLVKQLLPDDVDSDNEHT